MEERRRIAKIPEEVKCKTKPELGAGLIQRASHWEDAHAPVLGDIAYGENNELRERLHKAEFSYVLSVSAQTAVLFRRDDVCAARAQGFNWAPTRSASPIGSRSRSLSSSRAFNARTSRPWHPGTDGEPMSSRFAFEYAYVPLMAGSRAFSPSRARSG